MRNNEKKTAMGNTRTRRTNGQEQYSSQVIYEEFQPAFDWTQDSQDHILLLDLPGFKEENVKMLVDNAGKVTISGERHLGENRYRRFKQVLETPKDSNFNKMNGKFENGLLFVVFPKNNTVGGGQESKKEIETDQRNKVEISTKTEIHPKEDLGKRLQNDRQVGDKKEKGTKGDRKIDGEGLKGESGDRDSNTKTSSKPHEDISQDSNPESEQEFGDREWFPNRFMENLMTKIKINKSAIVTAIVAFSIGFYISRKLGSREDSE